MTRVLAPADIARIVADVGLTPLLDQLIARLTTAFGSHDPDLIATVDRSGFHYVKPELGLIEWMPAMEHGRLVSVKMVGYHPNNPVERGVPSVLATTSLYGTSDGRLLALCEATFLTALRTGAASAIATDVLAKTGPIVLGVIGCGAQAVTQVHAVSRMRPIRRVIAYDANTDVAMSLVRRIPIDDLVVEVVDSEHVGDLAASSDVICTATSVDPEHEPVLPEVEFRPGLHVNAVGADFRGKLELPESVTRRALVCPDVASQCLLEGEAQRLEPDELGPDLVTLVRDRAQYERYRSSLTVFDSTGWALEDLVAAELVLDHADRIGVGIEIDLHPIPSDPHDPYEIVR